MGLGSLMSVELRRRLEGQFELSLAKMFTFNFATAAKLTDFIASGDWPGSNAVAGEVTVAAAGARLRRPRWCSRAGA